MAHINMGERFGPLIQFQLKVAYLTTEQREYESEIYEVSLGTSQNVDEEEYIEKLQERINALSDPFLKPFNGGRASMDLELGIVKTQMAAFDRFLSEEEKKIKDAEDFAQFVQRALNRCAHLFFRLNRIELMDPVEIERRGRLNNKLLAQYHNIVGFGRTWPQNTGLEEGGIEETEPQHHSTEKGRGEMFGQTDYSQERINIFDIRTPELRSGVDLSRGEDESEERRLAQTDRNQEQNRLSAGQFSLEQNMREMRTELHKQRIQFEQRFENEHFTLLKYTEAAKKDLIKHKEELEVRMSMHNEELKQCIEKYMFQILANQKNDTPPFPTHTPRFRQMNFNENRYEERNFTENGYQGRLEENRHEEQVRQFPTEQREQGQHWRQRIHTSGTFIPEEIRRNGRSSASEFEERAKKLKAISQEIKNHRLYFGGKFSQSFEVYISMLRQFMSNMGLSSSEMREYMYLTLEGKPREWYVSLEQAEKELPVNDFLALLRKRFVDNRTPASWIAELENQKYDFKRHGHISDWVDTMNLKMMADGCGWSDSDRVKMIVRSFPERLRIPLHSKRINSVRELREELDELYPIDRNGATNTNHHRFNTYGRNQEIAEVKTTEENKSDDELEEESEVCMMNERNFVNKKAYRAERKTFENRNFVPHTHSVAKESKRCFRCGEEGHYFKECTAKQIKIACFWCKRPEVVVSTCTTPECIQRREEKAKNAH